MLLLSEQLLFCSWHRTRLNTNSFVVAQRLACLPFFMLISLSFAFFLYICTFVMFWLFIFVCVLCLWLTKATGGHTIRSYFQSEPQQRCDSWRGCSAVAFFRTPELPFFMIPEKCFWSVSFLISSQSMHASILNPHLISFLLASLLSTSGRQF